MNFQVPTCLGIPIPKSVKDLVRAPPACLPTRGDHETIEILDNRGKELARPEDDIKQTLNLAAGLSDILILLERPRRREDHPTNVGFEDFVKSCKTLLAVDELIRFATKGARSIHTVTVLDAFSYQPDKGATEQDNQSHEVLARIIRSKKPKVILRCHRDAYQVEWLKQIEQPAEDYQLARKEISIANDHSTVVLQSFHPSCAINNADCRPEYRALLLYHFVAAFSELHSNFALPETADEIRKLCLIKGERVPEAIPHYETWQAARRISETLEKAYDGPDKGTFVGIIDETQSERRSKEIDAFDAMYKSLRHLFGNAKSPGGLAIAKVVLFLWKKHFRQDPLYDHITSCLLLCGDNQENWFAHEVRPAPDQSGLEVPFQGLQISTSPTISDIQAMSASLDISRSYHLQRV